MPDRYQVIVADPPWLIRWSGGSVTAGSSSGSKRVYPKRAGCPWDYRRAAIEEADRG